MQILVFSDDRNSRGLWRDAFEDLGLGVLFAGSVAELGTATSKRRYGLVLADLSGVPSKELLSALHEANQQAAWAIAVSSPCSDFDLSEFLGAGFDEVVSQQVALRYLPCRVQRATHLVKLERHLVESKKLESIGELAAGIAHEINTPIQYVGDNTRFVKEACEDIGEILSCCQALIASVEVSSLSNDETDNLKQAMSDADVEYLVEEIPSAIKQTLEGVDRVSNIVRAMKEFSHPGESEMIAADLTHEIENTVMVARNEWKYVADVELDFDRELPAVPCLTGELNQVILNLLVNAAHAIGDAIGTTPTSKGKISIRTRQVEDYAEISVADTGSGIPEELVEKIFQPFFTTKSAGKGTGQGLAIAHTVIVEKHAGTLTVNSVLGEGTTFVIRIPLEQQGDVKDDCQDSLCR